MVPRLAPDAWDSVPELKAPHYASTCTQIPCRRAQLPPSGIDILFAFLLSSFSSLGPCHLICNPGGLATATSLPPTIMVLEATMIVVDNSEASRNGDYLYGSWGEPDGAEKLTSLSGRIASGRNPKPFH